MSIVHKSYVEELQELDVPEWRGERHYMIPFIYDEGLPKEIQRYTSVISHMFQNVNFHRNHLAFIMIDESDVQVGEYHRRSGKHVDGNWEKVNRTTQVGNFSSGHSAPRHGAPTYKTTTSIECANNVGNQSILLLTNYASCVAYEGTYVRDFGANWDGGSCHDVDVSHMNPVMLEANRVYKIDSATIHESLPVKENVKRTLIRINYDPIN